MAWKCASPKSYTYMVILVSTTEVVTYLHSNFMIRPQMRLAWPGISKYFYVWVYYIRKRSPFHRSSGLLSLYRSSNTVCSCRRRLVCAQYTQEARLSPLWQLTLGYSANIRWGNASESCAKAVTALAHLWSNGSQAHDAMKGCKGLRRDRQDRSIFGKLWMNIALRN